MILSGPPGAGKTTTAGALAARFDKAAQVEADRFFEFIRSGYVEPWRPESHGQNTAVMQIVARAAASYAEAGYFTIVEGIVIPRWFLEPLRESLAAAGHAVAYAVLRAPLELCVSRRGAIAAGVVERIWGEFADLGPLERHAIDPGDAGPDAVAELLETRLADLELPTR